MNYLTLNEFKATFDTLGIKYTLEPYNHTTGGNYTKFGKGEPCEMCICIPDPNHDGAEVRLCFLEDGSIFDYIHNNWREPALVVDESELDDPFKRQGKTGGKQGCHVWVPVEEERVAPTPGRRKPKVKSEKTSRDELLGVRQGVPASKIITAIIQRIRRQPTFSQTVEYNLTSLNAFYNLFSVRSHIPFEVYKRQRDKIFCAVADSPAEKKYVEALDAQFGERYQTCFTELVQKERNESLRLRLVRTL